MMIETGANIAATVYRNGELVARDVTVTLPTVTHKTQTVQAMGDLELPLIGQIEAMTATITKKGYSAELAKLATPNACDLEIRFIQTVTASDGTSKPEGCRAFMRAASKTLPGGDVTPGEVGETAVEFSVTRYQLFVGGAELCLIDQVKNQLRINGTDYAEDVRSLL